MRDAPWMRSRPSSAATKSLKSAWAPSGRTDPYATSTSAEASKSETKDRVQQAEIRALMRSGDGSADVFRQLPESEGAETREMAVRAIAGSKGVGRAPWPWQ